MSEENIRPESNNASPSADSADKASETVSGLTELRKGLTALRKRKIDDGLIRSEIYYLLLQNLRDPSQILNEDDVELMERVLREANARDLSPDLMDIRGEEIKFLGIPASMFKQLREKTEETLHDAALAFERIGSDQQEIEQLRTETRRVLARLRAA